ncbi:MAG: hypothetical protein ACRELF_05130 [Gemmataceae bacterium]
MKPDTTIWPSLVQKTADRVEVEYQRTGEDYAAWQLYAWDKSITRLSRSMSSWLVRLSIWAVLCTIVLVLILLLFLGATALLTQDKDLLPLLPGVFILLILFVVLIRGVGPNSSPRSLARRAVIRQLRLLTKGIRPLRQRVILAPDKVVETSLDLRGKLETVLDWTVFDAIELGEKHVFFITQSNMVVIVPQSAFTDEKEFLDFVETAWAFHRRAGDNSPVSQPASPSPPETDRAESRITTRSDDRIVP